MMGGTPARGPQAAAQAALLRTVILSGSDWPRTRPGYDNDDAQFASLGCAAADPDHLPDPDRARQRGHHGADLGRRTRPRRDPAVAAEVDSRRPAPRLLAPPGRAARGAVVPDRPPPRLAPPRCRCQPRAAHDRCSAQPTLELQSARNCRDQCVSLRPGVGRCSGRLRRGQWVVAETSAQVDGRRGGSPLLTGPSSPGGLWCGRVVLAAASWPQADKDRRSAPNDPQSRHQRRRRALLFPLGLRPGVGLGGGAGEEDLSLTHDVGLGLLGSVALEDLGSIPHAPAPDDPDERRTVAAVFRPACSRTA